MSVTTVWQTTRQAKYQSNGHRPREALFSKAIRCATRFAARVTPRFSTIRRFTLQCTGLGLVDAAFWQLGTLPGLLATGLSLFILDWLVTE